MTNSEIISEKCGVIFTREMKNEMDNFDPVVIFGNNLDKNHISITRHRVLVGEAIKLIRDMAMNGADKHELINAIKYAIVTIDSVKQRLNYKKAYTDLGIGDLYKKYHKQEVQNA